MLSLDLCSWRGGHLRGMYSVKGVRMDCPHDFPRGSKCVGRMVGEWEESRVPRVRRESLRPRL
jgi:hypothetical protein